MKYDEKLTWFNAINNCLANNGDLAPFTDISVLSGIVGTNGSWVGLRHTKWNWLYAGLHLLYVHYIANLCWLCAGCVMCYSISSSGLQKWLIFRHVVLSIVLLEIIVLQIENAAARSDSFIECLDKSETITLLLTLWFFINPTRPILLGRSYKIFSSSWESVRFRVRVSIVIRLRQTKNFFRSRMTFPCVSGRIFLRRSTIHSDFDLLLWLTYLFPANVLFISWPPWQ